MAVRRFLVAGRYRLHEPVGSGGMGRVWMARDEMLHRDVAVKEFVPPEWMTDDEKSRLRDSTLREARSAARLNHPHVVRIYDVVHADDLPWIVMEYVPSRSLHQVINEDGPYPPVDAARMGLDVLDALTAAHAAGVLHRDVKPHNVLIGTDGRVVLTDFGLATFVDDGAVTGPGLVIGSPQYVSPERAGIGASTVESDLWSFGATLYAAVEGRSPYARENAMATLIALATEPPIAPQRAGPLAGVLRGLLRRDPADRLTASEVERRLRAVVAATGGPVPAARQSATRQSATRQSATRQSATQASSGGRATVVPGQRRSAEDDRALDGALPASPVTVLSPSLSTDPGTGGPIAPPPRRHPPVRQQPRHAPPAKVKRSLMLPSVLAVVVLGVLGLIGARWMPGRVDEHRDRPAGSALVRAAAPSNRASSITPALGFTSIACRTPVPPGAPRTPQPHAKRAADGWSLPAGWSYYVDPSGYRVAVPDGWTYEQVGTTMCFRDTDSARTLSVDPARDPASDPVRACVTEAARLVRAGVLRDYRQISIRRASPQIKAADWEFTYAGSSGRLHSTTRWFASGGKAYALSWTTSDFDWRINLSLHSMVISSFAAGR